MQENVGNMGRTLRGMAGPVLMWLGYEQLGAKSGRGWGIATMIAGALALESAVTRVCPINAVLGLDTRRHDS